jgi:hypothetical protein
MSAGSDEYHPIFVKGLVGRRSAFVIIFQAPAAETAPPGVGCGGTVGQRSAAAHRADMETTRDVPKFSGAEINLLSCGHFKNQKQK